MLSAPWKDTIWHFKGGRYVCSGPIRIKWGIRNGWDRTLTLKNCFYQVWSRWGGEKKERSASPSAIFVQLLRSCPNICFNILADFLLITSESCIKLILDVLTQQGSWKGSWTFSLHVLPWQTVRCDMAFSRLRPVSPKEKSLLKSIVYSNDHVRTHHSGLKTDAVIFPYGNSCSFYVCFVIGRENTWKKTVKRFACPSWQCWCTYVCIDIFLNVHGYDTPKAIPTFLWEVIFRNEDQHPFPILQPSPLLVKLVWIPLATACTTDVCYCGFYSDKKSQHQPLFCSLFLNCFLHHKW